MSKLWLIALRVVIKLDLWAKCEPRWTSQPILFLYSLSPQTFPFSSPNHSLPPPPPWPTSLSLKCFSIHHGQTLSLLYNSDLERKSFRSRETRRRFLPKKVLDLEKESFRSRERKVSDLKRELRRKFEREGVLASLKNDHWSVCCKAKVMSVNIDLVCLCGIVVW